MLRQICAVRFTPKSGDVLGRMRFGVPRSMLRFHRIAAGFRREARPGRDPPRADGGSASPGRLEGLLRGGAGGDGGGGGPRPSAVGRSHRTRATATSANLLTSTTLIYSISTSEFRDTGGKWALDWGDDHTNEIDFCPVDIGQPLSGRQSLDGSTASRAAWRRGVLT